METLDRGSADRALHPAEAPGIFTEAFVRTAAEEIVAEVRRAGFWTLEGALAGPYVDEMLRQIDFDSYLVNTNEMGVVCASNQRFLSHCLAASKNAYDVIVSERVLEICRAYFGGPFKLTNQRIYQTHTRGHMPWHTDNNCQAGYELSGKHQLPGLLFLIYLSDVTQNAFQVLRDSHLWSKQHSDNYFSDQFIAANHAEEIVTFPRNRGTLFVCDIHAIHRAEPFRNRDYERFTLLFQVDAVVPEYPDHGEKLLVNTAFVNRRDPEVLDYLGFGRPAAYPTFPATSAATMAPRDLWRMQKSLIPKVARAFGKAVLKAIIPGRVVVNLKRWIWRVSHRSHAAQAGAAFKKAQP